MCNLSWTPHSNLEKDNSLNHSRVRPRIGCLELWSIGLHNLKKLYRRIAHQYISGNTLLTHTSYDSVWSDMIA